MIRIQGDLLDLAGRPASVQHAIDALGRAEQDERGAVFTRPEVVDFILDLVGYSPDLPLSQMPLLEPSVGTGAFLVAALQRLLQSFHAHGGTPSTAEHDLADAIRGIELHGESLKAAREQCHSILAAAELSDSTCRRLLDRWLHVDDFLLHDPEKSFHFVIGNPPYLRQEAIPGILLAEYRRKFSTLYDRADLFIPFFQKGLSLLEEGGRLGFICSDRWLKNRYGGPLRQLIRDHYSLDIVVDMNETDAFEGKVSAYPAITVVSRTEQHGIRFSSKPQIDRSSLKSLAQDLTGPSLAPSRKMEEGRTYGQGQDPWLLGDFSLLKVVSKMESTFPSLAEAGCKVGIGVATGCDRVYIAKEGELPIEEDRILPLAMASDIQNGLVHHSGHFLLNPFKEDGDLVDLADFPLLREYLEANKDQILGRHVAKKNPQKWFRTIDRIYPSLVLKPKLLIPDIKGTPCVGFDPGEYYPHHNLYTLSSETWDLRALRTLLLSSLATAVIGLYSVRMRGGFLRFQAQYLRRLHVPHWRDVPSAIRHSLCHPPRETDRSDEAIFDLFQLDRNERHLITEFANRVQSP